MNYSNSTILQTKTRKRNLDCIAAGFSLCKATMPTTEEKEPEAPVRVRLAFGDRDLLTKEQRSQGFARSWAAIRPEHTTVADFARDIISRFGLSTSAIHGLIFSMDGFALPSFESTSVFRDNDLIRVKHKINKNKKTAVAMPDENLQIQGNEIIDKETVPSDDGCLLIENGVNGSHTRRSSKKRKRVLTAGTKRKHKKIEGPENTKNKGVACTSQNTSENQHGQEFHNRDVLSKEQKSMMLQKFKDKFIEINGTPAGSHQWLHRSKLDDPDAPKSRKKWKSLSQSDAQNEGTSQLRTSNSMSTDEEDDKDFESLNPLTCLPMEGDVIAYRLMEASSGRRQLSVFRVGKVIRFDPITMLILLGPVPQYPIFPNGEISESQKSMYKEDGTLQIDFGSLVDLRLVEESESRKSCSQSKVITWQIETGFHAGVDKNMNSAWNAAEASNANEETRTGWGTWTPNVSRNRASCQGMGQRGSRIQSRGGYRGRNGGLHRNVNSYWQAGEDEYGQRTCAMNNSRYSGPHPHRGRNGNRFGPYDSFSRRMNNRAGSNDNSAWEANCETTNANESTQTLENGWDTWAPNTSWSVASWSRMGQNSSGFGSTSGISKVTRKSRGGRRSNSKFCK